MKRVDVVVVGAGPAGLAAAVAASRAGAGVALVDTQPRAGGLFLAERAASPFNDESTRAVDDLIERLHREPVDLYYESRVWAVGGKRSLAIRQPDRSFFLDADRIVLATGGFDRRVAFPGWTLGGVQSAREFVRSLRAGKSLSGRKMLLVGAGAMLRWLAVEAVTSGGEIIAVVESSTRRRGIAVIAESLPFRSNLQAYDRPLQSLQKAKTSFMEGYALVEARGADSVQQAIVARMDASGNVDRSSEKMFDVDEIVLGFGTAPAFELPQVLGCSVEFLPKRGVFSLKVDDRYQTTEHGIFTAGDLTAATDVQMAIQQGRIAGVSAAEQVGRIVESEARGRLIESRRDLEKLGRFADYLATLAPFPAGLSELPREDTIVCPCEGVRAGEVRRAVGDWGPALAGIQAATGCGSGACHGRICGSIIQHIAARFADRPIEETGVFDAGSPTEPLTIQEVSEPIETAL